TMGNDTTVLDVTAAGAPYQVDFKAVRVQTVPVEVRDLNGQPMPYAKVLFASPDDYGMTFQTTADAHGQVELRHVSGRKYLLNACSGDSMTLSPTELGADAAGPVVLRPADGVRPTLTGTVTSEMGKPIAHAIVRVDGRTSQDYRNGWSFMTTTLTDDAGRFRLRSVWPNMGLTIRIRAAGSTEQTKELGQLAPGETRDAGEVVMPVADMVVTGVVLDSDDKPVAGVSMDVNRPGGGSFSRRIMGASGLDGTFRIEGLPREQLLLVPDQFAYDSYPVPLGPDNLKVVVRVIPRNKQILYTDHFNPPLVSETAGFKVTLTALHRYWGYGPNHELQRCLGLDLEAQAEPRDWFAKSVTAVDDQGRVLPRSSVRYRIEGNNPGRGVELPAEGVTKLSKIMLGDKVLFENVPLQKELTATP
ncbi:MAG: carboxypeptidase-like regulatory domain-containing protein, partial [Armatimonadia bacterium]